MEESINQRLKKFVEEQSINEPDTYKYLGTRRQVWNGWLNAEEAIPLNKVQKLIGRFSDLNARWLLTGEGEMLLNSNKKNKSYKNIENVDPIQEPHITTYSCPDCIEKERIIQAQKKTIEIQEKYISSLEVGHEKNGKAV